MKSDTSPAQRTLANRALFIFAVLGGLFLAGISHAANVIATFNSAADIPVTANGYTATGNTLDVTLNFAPTPGTNLTVVRNTALTFINGTFDNLANGATLNLSYNGTTYPFIAWYYGGAGRDFVLLWPYTGLAAWGQNSSGQLGDNSTTARTAPRSVEQAGVLAGKTIVQVARGSAHTLALTTEGKVYAWGWNGGALGDNTNTTQQNTPVAVNTDSGTSALFGKTVIAISAGFSHSLALCSDGTVAAWGSNDSGQLGTNRISINDHTPAAVNTANGTSALFEKTVVSIFAGTDHSLALCSDGTVTAWGLNNYGQLGDNTTNNRYAAVSVNTANGTSGLFGKTVMAISAGFSHSLALCSDGTVAAWGWNAHGQLGDNTTAQHNAPVGVNTANGTSALFGKTVITISAGFSHSLGLCSDGTVAAWGENFEGQLGDNTTTERHTPVSVNTTDGVSAIFGKVVTAISTGGGHSLALCSDGTVAAWGRNIYGQLGDNSMESRLAPVAVNTTTGISALAGKTVTAIGTNGSGASHSTVVYATTPPEISLDVLDPSPTSLANNASTVDFGTTSYGTLTFRISNTSALPLANISASISGANASDFILGQPASVVASNASTTFQVTFAPGSAGAKSATLQIASNDPDENPFRVALAGTRPVPADLTATFNSASDVPLTSYGFNASGSALNLTLNFAPTPGTNLTVIRNTGRNFIFSQFNNAPNGATVNLTYNGTTYPFIAWYYGGDGNDLVLLWPYTGLAAWGLNSSGQLGNNSTVDCPAPTPVDQTGVLVGKTIVQVAHGSVHTLALTTEGKVYAWGDNVYGQLGDNSSTQRFAPVAVNTTNGTSALYGKTVIAVAVGATFSLALCSDGTIAAWGLDDNGQLGDNAAIGNIQRTPVAVNTTSGTSALFGKTVTAIEAGYDHSLALCSDGTISAWGQGGSGQLGDNTTKVRYAPVVVNAASGTSALFGKTVVAISAGYHRSLALCSDYTVAAWGWNVYGQLGDNTTTVRQAPVAVTTASGISALFGKTVTTISAGGYHSLALCSDGTVAAWGYNSDGQLGDNTTTDHHAPAAVNTTNGTSALFGKTVTDISAGFSHNLALCSDGTLATWGKNTVGQLGDNTTTNRSAPIAVNTDNGTSALFGKTVTAIGASSSQGAHNTVIYAITPPLIALEVLEPSPTSLTNNTSTVNYGSTQYGIRTFRIKNTSEWPLTGIAATVSGSDAADFSIIYQPSSVINPGQSAIFQVIFAAGSAGVKNATLQIATTDNAVTPFIISLTGTRPQLAGYNVIFNSANEMPIVTNGLNVSGEQLDITLNFAPTPGTNLTVIRNTGRIFISGQFSNIANGSTVNLPYNGTIYSFVAWYYGGDGNDLVLLWPYSGLAAWGGNANGQLGDGTTTDRFAPVAVLQNGVLAGKTIVQVARGDLHTLALTSEGKVYAWGSNSSGQLGDGTTLQSTTPVAVNTAQATSALYGKAVVAISGGLTHSLALCDDGTVVTWGSNTLGQLGDNTTTQRTSPVLVNTASGTSALFGKKVTSISAGASHNLVLCSDGTVAAWGDNGLGQIGDDTATAQRNAPVLVNTANNSALFNKTVTGVSGGAAHSLALCSDGTLTAWGSSQFGQVGDNTTTLRRLPVAVNTASGVSALFGKTISTFAAGGNHSLAFCTDGTIVAWGRNIYGQVGDNTSGNNRLAPVAVNTTNGVSALFGKTISSVVTCSNHNMALCNDGTLVAWGRNNNGRIGDNTVSNIRPAPVLINTTTGVSALASQVVTSFGNSSANSGHSTAIYGLPAPVATTLSATNIKSNRVTFTATINPSGSTSTAQFQYGLDTNYGTNVAITLSPNNGSVNQNVSAAITGLAVGTTYHYRATVTANGITTYGTDQTFTTNHLPVLALPSSPLLVEATSASGAVVNFNATASDSEDGALTPNLSRTSGSTFAIGDTIVNASATDSAAETTNSNFTVRVQDTTAPVFTPPPVSRNVNSDAAGNYTLPDFTTTVAATDAVGITTYTQTPAPGTGYNVGNTIPITLTAKDAANNTRTANFTLTVAQLITLESWRQNHFGAPANAGSAANTFDLDKDGNCNLLEYAFGLNPNHPDRNQLPQPQLNGGNIGYNFTEPPGISGITYGAEWSTTLQPGSWTPIPDTGNGNQHIFTLPTAGHSPLTLRLTVTTQ